MSTHKEINMYKDEVHLWKEKHTIITEKYTKVEKSVRESKGSSHHYEERIIELESDLKRLKLALYELKETHEHDDHRNHDQQ